MTGGREAVQVSVADTGPGIDPQVLRRIWEPYVTHKAGGTGLGLAIARQAVWAHDGTVAAESTVGQGTRIVFTVPVRGVVEQQRHEEPQDLQEEPWELK